MSELVYINTSKLAEWAAEKPLIATVMESYLGSYVLKISEPGQSQEWIVSTYLSDKPKLYKKADALLKEAKNLGLKTVCFELNNKNGE